MQLSENEFPNAAATIRNNTYVDDILGSLASKQEADQITRQIDTMRLKGGFQVKGWTISSDNSERTLQVCQTTHKSDANISKVLGVVWNSKSDELKRIEQNAINLRSFFFIHS